jgi:putative ABC transport system permease protein
MSEERTTLHDFWLTRVTYACKALFRSPRFLFLSVGTLAVSTGLTLFLLAVGYAVVMRSLPIPRAETITVVQSSDRAAAGAQFGVSVADWDDLRQRANAFSDTALVRARDVLLQRDGNMDRVTGAEFTPGLLPMLDTQVHLGRSFDQDDESSVILSFGYWQREFGGDPAVLGKSLVLDGVVAGEIIGVMPAGFRLFALLFRADPAIYLPAFDAAEGSHRVRRDRIWTALGRLRPGVTAHEARSRIAAVAAQLKQEHPRDYETHEFRAQMLPAAVQGYWRTAILFLLGAVVLVLIAACVNVAGLFLIWISSRRRQFAIRMALGARWTHVAIEVLVQALLVAFAGSALGLILAYWSVRLLPLAGIAALEIPRIEETHVGAWVAAAGAALALVVGALVSLVPLLSLRSGRLQDALVDRPLTAAARPQSIRALFAAAQVSIVTVLMLTSATLISTFLALSSRELGYNYEKVLSMRMTLPYQQGFSQQLHVVNAILDRIGGMNGVSSAATSYPSPAQSDFVRPFELDSEIGTAQTGVPRMARLQRVSSNYFTAMKIRLLHGRLFRSETARFEEGVVVVNRSFAEQFLKPRWEGRQISMRQFWPDRRFPIAGIVDDTFESVTASATPTIYMSTPLNYLHLLVRTTAPDITPMTLRDAVKRVSQSVAVDQLSELGDAAGTPVARVKVQLALVIAFAFVAMVLAVVGIFATLSLSVSERLREFGIRAALGGTPCRLAFAMFRSMLVAVAAGAVLGILVMQAVSRLLASYVAGMRANGLMETVFVCVFLVAACIAASWSPVRRILHLRPATLLRTP